MSTEIVDTELKDHTATVFWGGNNRGVCIQVTPTKPTHLNNGYIQLTLSEASELAFQLSRFVMQESKRRQKLLKDEIERMKIFDKTVFQEISNLDLDAIEYECNRLLVSVIDTVCPRNAS
jgi:hypothetical protein